MKSVLMTVFAAAGLLLAVQPDASAGDRRSTATSYSTRTVAPYSTAQVAPNGSMYERKCMMLPCGTRWCYNVKR